MPSAAVWRKGAFAPLPGLIAVFVSATALSGCWEGTTSEGLTTILSIEGTAEFSSDGTGAFAPLHLSDHPGGHAILTTMPGSRVALAPLPNCLLHLEGDTTLEVVRIALTKDGNETGSDIRGRHVDLRLTSGRLLASHSWGEAIARFTVTTAHGQLIVSSNALFWIETDAARTRITCASGSIEFRPKEASSTTPIAPGFVGASSGTDLNLTPAEADPAAQEGVVEALRLEQELRELAGRNRNVLSR